MDSNVLVSAGQRLLDELDRTDNAPRAAMWVSNPDTDIWRLWLVPPRPITDKREFYRKVAEAVSTARDDLQGIDASDTEFVREDHPAMRALSRMFHIEGKSSVHLSSNMLNGFYLPDGIILRMAL